SINVEKPADIVGATGDVELVDSRAAGVFEGEPAIASDVLEFQRQQVCAASGEFLSNLNASGVGQRAVIVEKYLVPSGWRDDLERIVAALPVDDQELGAGDRDGRKLRAGDGGAIGAEPVDDDRRRTVDVVDDDGVAAGRRIAGVDRDVFESAWRE